MRRKTKNTPKLHKTATVRYRIYKRSTDGLLHDVENMYGDRIFYDAYASIDEAQGAILESTECDPYGEYIVMPVVICNMVEDNSKWLR